jgi:putative heme transporter
MAEQGDAAVPDDPVEVSAQRAKPTGWALWRRRLLQVWAPGRYVVGIGLAALAFAALNGQRGELTGATNLLGALKTPWLVLAAGVEAVSLVCFAAMQGYLLRCGGVRLGRWRMLAVTIGAGAIASSLPAGPAVSSVFAYHQYRRRGADEALAVWTLIATLTCASLSLAVVATGGLLLAEQEGASLDLIGVTAGVLVVSVLAWLIVGQRKLIINALAGLIHVMQRLTGFPRRHSAELLESLFSRLRRVHLDFHDLLIAMAWALGNWCFDCACLAFCFLAVGAGVPWRGLLLAYGAAQLASNLPITPGGLGVVEGSLTIALVAFGGVELTTVAAVLLYRIISFWGFLPVGWGGWGILTWNNRVIDHRKKIVEAIGAESVAAHGGNDGAVAGGVTVVTNARLAAGGTSASDLERSSS